MKARRWSRVLRIGLILVAVLVMAVVVTLQLPAFGGRIGGERLARIRQSAVYVNGRFENTPPARTNNSLLDNYRLYQQGQVREPQGTIPVVPISPATLLAAPAPGLRVWWLGHASSMVEIDGVRVLMDPVFSDVVSPVPVGPTRFHPPPLPLEALEGIDAVLISHDHYDHLDMATVRHLAQRNTHFYVGLGIGAHLERWGVPAERIHEMAWWDSIDVRGVRITCTPARHYSGRTRMNNPTLWASWAVRGPNHSVYYSGDTGYAEHFSQIRQRLGDTELTLIKVGAYGSTWLDIHMDPESAVRAHQDLGGRVMLPVHWGTFNLAYHAWGEPIERTLAAASAQGVTVVTPRVGEAVDLDTPWTNVAWYTPLIARR